MQGKRGLAFSILTPYYGHVRSTTQQQQQCQCQISCSCSSSYFSLSINFSLSRQVRSSCHTFHTGAEGFCSTKADTLIYIFPPYISLSPFLSASSCHTPHPDAEVWWILVRLVTVTLSCSLMLLPSRSSVTALVIHLAFLRARFHPCHSPLRLLDLPWSCLCYML